MRICRSVVATPTATLARMIKNAGSASAGVIAKICAMYASENTEVRPALSTVDSNMEAMAPMLARRVERLPAAYSLKNEAGSDSRRIIAAACTDTLSLVSMRDITSCFTPPIRIWENMAPTRSAAMGPMSDASPESTTGPNTMLFTVGTSMPRSVIASVASATNT